MASSNSTSSFTAVNENDFSQLDLSGKIIIKVQYLDDIRRIPIIGDEITYDELILMMQRLFKLQPVDEIQLKYRDDDNDLISIIDDNDLSFAIQYSRVLKLMMYVNKVNETNAGLAKVPANYKLICHELIEIRNRCNLLLEKLHLDPSKQSSNNNALSDTNEMQTQTETNEQKLFGQPPKELDPLNSQAEQKKPDNSSTDSRPDNRNEQLEQKSSMPQSNYSLKLILFQSNLIPIFNFVSSCPTTSLATGLSSPTNSSTNAAGFC